MSRFSRLFHDEKGSVFDRFALVCAVISVICVLGAHGLDRLGQSGFSLHGHDNAVDYTATGSISRRAQDAGLNPCAAK